MGYMAFFMGSGSKPTLSSRFWKVALKSYSIFRMAALISYWSFSSNLFIRW